MGSRHGSSLEASKSECQKQRRPLDKPNDINQAEGRRQAKTWKDDTKINLQPTKVHRDNHDVTSDTTKLTAAQDGLKWDSMESDFVRSRLKQPTRHTTTTIRPTTTAQTTWRRRRHIADPKLFFMKTEATTNNEHNEQCSSDTVRRESITLLFPTAGTGPIHQRWHEACTGKHRHLFCMMRAIRQTGLTHLGLR